LSARIPERGRIVAHSTGRNPEWWSEDVITWNIRAQDTTLPRHVNLSLTVNPLGAYRVQRADGLETGTEKLLVATHLDAAEWTVEAAIPLAHVQLRGSRSRGELHLSLGSRRPLLPRAARCNCAGDWFCWSDLWTGATGWRKIQPLPSWLANALRQRNSDR
jgi:hypothetical protein